MKNLHLEWYPVGESWIGYACPPIVEYECVLGHDAQGREWRARSKYKEDEHRFHVWFDHMEGIGPFLREEVVYADSYWEAKKERHSLARCDYEDIATVIENFISLNDIR